jgi:hypothetical protein
MERSIRLTGILEQATVLNLVAAAADDDGGKSKRLDGFECN